MAIGRKARTAALKLLVEVDGGAYTLDLRRNSSDCEYTLQGAEASTGVASVAAIAPGAYSVLLQDRSFIVNLVRQGGALEAWVGGRRHSIVVADARDRTAKVSAAGASGPLEVRAQMPGKVIKVLVERGTAVEAGQGLMVVEAMKMQNEIKSSKDGTVSKICVVEGATVSAGEVLMVVN